MAQHSAVRPLEAQAEVKSSTLFRSMPAVCRLVYASSVTLSGMETYGWRRSSQ